MLGRATYRWKIGFQLLYKLIENANIFKGEDIEGLYVDVRIPVGIPEYYIPRS